MVLDNRAYEIVLPSADPDGTGSREFRFEGHVGEDSQPPQYQSDIQTEVTSGGQRIGNVLANILGDTDESPVQQIGVSLGAGLHQITLSFAVSIVDERPDGTPLQWGDDATETLTATSATGQHPADKVQIFEDVMSKVQPDSLPENGITGSDALAEVHYNQRRPSGVLEPLQVIPTNVQPTYQRAQSAGITFTGVTAKSLDDVIDSLDRTKRGASQ